MSIVYLSSPYTPLGRCAINCKMYFLFGSITFGLNAMFSSSIGFVTMVPKTSELIYIVTGDNCYACIQTLRSALHKLRYGNTIEIENGFRALQEN